MVHLGLKESYQDACAVSLERPFVVLVALCRLPCTGRNGTKNTFACLLFHLAHAESHKVLRSGLLQWLQMLVVLLLMGEAALRLYQKTSKLPLQWQLCCRKPLNATAAPKSGRGPFLCSPDKQPGTRVIFPNHSLNLITLSSFYCILRSAMHDTPGCSQRAMETWELSNSKC